MAQKPATFGYTGPKITRPQGKMTKASVTTAPKPRSRGWPGKMAHRKAHMASGYTMAGKRNIDALMAMGALKPVACTTSAHRACHAAG